MGVQEGLGAVPPSPAGQVYQSQLARVLPGEGRISGSGPGDLDMGKREREPLPIRGMVEAV